MPGKIIGLVNFKGAPGLPGSFPSLTVSWLVTIRQTGSTYFDINVFASLGACDLKH
jgi:hypothetical protein